MRQWRDLDGLERLYAAFVREHEETRRRWARGKVIEERAAFADYVRLLTDWRRLPYRDPGLPPELLPGDWTGSRAADLFFALGATGRPGSTPRRPLVSGCPGKA